MANDGAINKLVDEKALANFDRLIESVGLARNEFGLLIAEAIKFNAAIGGSKTFKEFQTNLDNAAKNYDKVVKAQDKARLEEIKLQKAREKAFDDFEKNLKKQEAALAKQKFRTAEAEREFVKLAKSLSDAEKNALDLGARFGSASPQFLRAAKEVRDIRAQVDALEQPLGNFKRNVGNYASGFNGLSNSINQLTREFPAFTNSVQTGFLALSNNLPIFFDQIAQVNNVLKESALANAVAAGEQATATALAGGASEEAANQIGELAKNQALAAAEGKRGVGIFKAIASSLFSVGTLLSIGVTLLVVYGKEIGEFVGALFKGREAMDLFVERQKALNAAAESTDFTNAIKQVNELEINIDLAKKGFLNKNKVLEQYNETVGATIGQANDLNQAEQLLTKNGDAYIKMMLLKAAANLSLEEAVKKMVDAEKSRLKALSDFRKTATDARVVSFGSTSFNAKEFEADEKRRQQALIKRKNAEIKISEDAAEAQKGIARKFQADASKIAFDNKFDFFGGNEDDRNNALKEQLELNKARIESVKRSAELIYTDESKSLQMRLDALKVFTQKSKELIRVDQQIQLSEVGISATKRQTIAIETETKLNEITLEGRSKDREIREEAERKLAEIAKVGLAQLEKAEQEKILVIQEAGQQRLLEIEKQKSDALNSLGDQYAAGLIKEKEYRERSYDIEAQAAADSLQIQIDALQKEIELEKENLKFGIGSNRDLAADEKKLAQLQIDISDLKTKKIIENAEREYEAKKALKEKERELESELFELGIAIGDARFEREQQNNDFALENVDKREEREKKALDTQILTQDQKAIRIAQIEAKAQADREQIEKRQRVLDLQRARFEKFADIGKIIGSTGVAIAKALPNIPLSILVGAIGAAQLAKVLAIPLPKFKDGGEMKYSSYAEFGHGTELRINPDGKMSLTSSTPEVGWVEKGTEFVSNANLKRMLAKPDQTHYVGGQVVDINKLIDEQKKSTNELKKAYSSRPEQRTIITKGGMKYIHNNGNSWNHYVNKNLN